jgi:hypothetical protein
VGQQITARREEENRKALRAQELRDRRDAFQRDAILALQEALAQYMPLVISARIEADRPLMPVRVPEAVALGWRINMLRARIFDDDLRRLAKKVQGYIHGASRAADIASLEHHGLMADRATRQMDDRVNALLKDLF